MVKSFQSRYARLRRLREQHEQSARTALTLRQAELQEIMRIETTQKQQLNHAMTTLGRQMEQGVAGSFLTSLIRQIEFQEEQIKNTSGHRHNAELLVQAAMNDLKAATVELKTVSELLEREFSLYQADVNKQQDIELQEQAAHAWQQRRTAPSKIRIAVSEEDDTQ